MAGERAFRSRTVLVSGAAGGIGRALAIRFGEAGARVALVDRDRAGLVTLARELAGAGVDALALPCDVTDAEACRNAVSEAQARLGAIEVLVNNAGVTHRSRFLDTDLSVYRRVMDVNFFGALHLTKAALEGLRARRGTIVVLSSVAGFAPLLGRTGYCASKHALHGLFETLRCELAPEGVRVLLVCPGFTATNIERNALGADGGPARRPQSRVGRVATPESVAEAVYRGVVASRRLVVLSPVGRLTWLLTRLSPAVYERLMSRQLGVELDPPA